MRENGIGATVANGGTVFVAHGLIPDIHGGSVRYGMKMQEFGDRFITLLSELRLMQQTSAWVHSAVRPRESRQDGP